MATATTTKLKVTYRKDRGAWYAQLSWTDSDHVRQRKSKRLEGPTKTLALEQGAVWQREIEEQNEAAELAKENPASTVTVSDCVNDFLEEKSRTNEPSTMSRYRGTSRNLIDPYLGDTLITQLTPQQISRWETSLLEGYKPNNVRKAHVLLKAALNLAVERDTLGKNPANSVKPPKVQSPRPNSLDARTTGVVLHYVDIDPTNPYSLGIRIAILTGLRQGEICALQWRDVDLSAGTLRVCKSIGCAQKADLTNVKTIPGDERHYVKETKTGESRVVTIPRGLADVLNRRKLQQQQQCMYTGTKFTPSLYVLGNPTGAPLSPDRLRDRWYEVARVFDLQGSEGRVPTFHDLRHTYATLQIANGVDVKTVSNQLGHKNAAMTLNTYASVDPDAARRAADTLEQSLEPLTNVGDVLEFPGTGTDGK